uniref:Protein TIC 214 n=1 Tax=Genlisea filiformis TaxID=700924 RepID=A0A2I6QDH4_9LAMI|nr:hypothetical chloroplast RF19 [Genlisea filiformis]AUN28434.1 hypothetical chloroplast RF19 [Genlisea filiformis]
MIFQSFLLGNLVALWMKIIQSVIVVGLYYGFLTTFSIGPSYLFLLRAQVMEEGTENKVSATTGFITGQFMIFLSIYYAPLHLALDRPHTITVLALPYLLFQFFWKNHKHFFDSGSTTRNSMRNFSIQCLFLNNLIFQFLNHFILPSSLLARLVKIYMFRCTNNMLFLTSSFIGWLMGQILLLKILEFLLVWQKQKKTNSIRSNKYIHSKKYFSSELRNLMDQVFRIVLFITCINYLGRIPFPILTKKLNKTKNVEEGVEKKMTYDQANENKQDDEKKGIYTSIFYTGQTDKNKIQDTVRVNRTKDTTRKTKQKSYLIHSNNTSKNSPSRKYTFGFEKFIVNFLLDFNKWNRPCRYIENNQFSCAVRNEMSQYFFGISKGDGKETISFTYPPIFSIFLESTKRGLYWLRLEKDSYNEFSYSNSFQIKKVNNLNNEFLNRIEGIDNEYTFFNLLEIRPQLCHDDSIHKFFSKGHDPLFNGPYRRPINLSSSIQQKINIRNLIDNFGINKLHHIFLEDAYFQQLEKKEADLDKKKVSTHFFDSLIFIKKFVFVKAQNSIDLNGKDYLLLPKGKPDSNYFITPNSNGQKKILRKGPKIQKKVPHWLYKLIDEIEQQSGEQHENGSIDYEIRSRKAKRVVILTTTNDDSDPQTKDSNTAPSDDPNEVALIRYSQQPDFRRGLIKGSMRAQRRKIVIWELFQTNVFSPLFLDRIEKPLIFSLEIPRLLQLIFRNWLHKRKTVQIVTEETNEKLRIEIAEAWDTIPFAQLIRGMMLLTQSVVRKYIILPSLILGKNIGRILLFQLPEWSEDLQEWHREMYVKCTYNGVPLSETEFPQNWLTDGIQIKIIFPFRMKPWHNSKRRSFPINRNLINNKKEKDDFSFLTIWGLESEFPFGRPRKQPSFFKPIFKELEKKKNKFHRIIHQLFSQIELPSGTTSSLSQKQIKPPVDKTSKNQINLTRINKEKKIIITPKMDNPSPKKKSSNRKKFQNKKREITTRRNPQLIVKLHLLFQLLIERIYPNSSLFILNILKKKIEVFLEETKNIIEKSISNNKRKQEKIPKKTKNLIPTPKKSLDTFFKSQTNPNMLYGVPYVSQAYLLYTLSQLQISNSDKLTFVRQFQVIRPFVKPKIKESLENQGMIRLHPNLDDKKLPSYFINHWQKWLRGHYPYDLSRPNGSRLIITKRLNKVRRIIQNKKEKLRNWNSADKDLFFFFKTHFEIDSFFLKKAVFEKYYNYDLFSYKFIIINSEKLINSEKHCFLDKGTLKAKTKFSSTAPKEKLFLISITNNMGHILYMKKGADRKYFDCKIINFELRQKTKIETWITTNINRNQNMKIRTTNYQKITKKDLIISKINPPNSKKEFFNWMGMNHETLKGGIGNPELWFFSEFLFRYNTYKKKPWFIPSKLLLLNWNINKKNNSEIKQTEKLAVKQEQRNKEENEPKEEHELTNRKDLESLPSPKNNIEENDTKLNLKKENTRKQYKSKTEAELELFLNRYLLFQFRGNEALTQPMLSNIKVYCLLLRLMDPKKITLSSIQKRELDLDIMLINLNLTRKELLKKGLFIIEPIRLSGKDGYFIMYQTVSISLVHKSKNQKQRYVASKQLAEMILPQQRITASGDKNLNLCIPENIFSFRRCRTLRILSCFNSKTNKNVTLVCNGKSLKNSSQVSHDKNDLDIYKNQVMKFKIFLWPNFRLEDLACMNRYWFNTSNGSHFTILRIHFYSQLKTCR